jgi:hypothetical protein
MKTTSTAATLATTSQRGEEASFGYAVEELMLL